MTDRRPLTHEEWVARAERDVRTRCFPWERVPDGPEHYLTADEVDELRALEVALSKATRPVLTREIRKLRATLPDMPTRTRERVRWYLSLSGDNQRRYAQLRRLEEVRADLTRTINGREARFSVLDVADLVPDREALDRYRALMERWERLHAQAAERATEEAVAREIERRKSPEAWARELERRARPAVLIVDL